MFNLPSNAVNPLVSIDPTDLRKSVIYPALAPIPAKDILTAFKAETAYEKSESSEVAHYGYSMDSTSLVKYLPDGASFQELKGEAYYAWKSAQLLRVVVDGLFVYENRTYRFTQELALKNWDTELSTDGDTDLVAVVEGIAEPTPVTGRAFIPQLGVALSAVPNTFIEDTEIPTSLAITPSGEIVSELGLTIKAVPTIPINPASAEAKSRDTQRLADLTDLQKALTSYKTDNGSYIKSDGLEQTISSKTLFEALVPKYLTAMPVDPLKSTYWYEYTSDGSAYTLRSVAEDSENTKAKYGKAFYYFEATN
jgi:hypothetical protein